MELWAMRIEGGLDENKEQSLLMALPPVQRQRLAAIPNRKRRQESLWAWSLLRSAMGGTLPEPSRTAWGKPWFPAAPAVQFSLSHTEGAVLVGIADHPVGVDIERIRPVNPKLMERMGCREAAAFFRCWVRREARVKRLGGTLGVMLQEEPPLEPGEVLFPLDLFPGYAACAVCREPETPRLRLLSMEQLS